jgi:hypothetical protein
MGCYYIDFSANKLNKWAVNIDQYFRSFQHKDNSINDTKLFKAYLDAIAEILTEIAYKATPNDQWELFRRGDILEIRSKKLQHNFRFYTWLNIDFNIETDFLFPQHILRMPDEFVKQFLELNEFGKFVFTENSRPNLPSRLTLLAKKKVKSNLFRLARHCILFAAQQNKNDINVEDVYGNFGSIQVSWPLNIKIEDLLNNATEVFKRFYQINYMLYRHEYILNHSKRKSGREIQARDEVDKKEQR